MKLGSTPIRFRLSSRYWIFSLLCLELLSSRCTRPLKTNLKGVAQPAIDRQFIDPDSPAVVAVEHLDKVIDNIESIAKNLVKGTMIEKSLTQMLGHYSATTIKADIKNFGIDSTKRVVAWLTKDARFIEIVLPITDHSKTISIIQHLVTQLGANEDVNTAENTSELNKGAGDSDGFVLIPDEANDTTKGDIFWHSSDAVENTRLGCHYDRRGYERCSFAIFGEGIPKSAFAALWNSSLDKNNKKQRFSRAVRAGGQLWIDFSMPKTRQLITETFEQFSPNMLETLSGIFGYFEDDDKGEIWFDIMPEAISYGERVIGHPHPQILRSADLQGMPSKAMMRYAGIVPDQHQIDVIERQLASFKAIGGSDNAPESSGDSVDQITDQVAERPSLTEVFLKHARPLLNASLGKSFYAFAKLGSVPATENNQKKASKKADWYEMLSKHVLKFGLVQHISGTLSNVELDKSLLKLTAIANKGFLKKAEARGLAGKLKSPLRIARRSSADDSTEVSAVWDLRFVKGDRSFGLGSVWREKNRLMFGFGKDVHNVLSPQLVTKDKMLSPASLTDLDTLRRTCGGVSTKSGSVCRELFDINDLSSIGRLLRALGPPDAAPIADLLTTVLERISKIEQGTVNDKDQLLMKGIVQFDFHSNGGAKTTTD